MSLICTDCGKEIETLPLECAHSLTNNDETHQCECYMENCGTILINEFVCESCCTNRNIMKLNKSFEQLSLENEEFKEELTFFKKNIIQTKLINSDFNMWVEFGDGVYLCDKGGKDNPSAVFICSQKIMNQILNGTVKPFDAFFGGELKIEGDLQYSLVYFDLIKLASEIISEARGA
ncbi:MAG: SCP2 sterol-binding domain-containing protein [Candidatus Lokiarchaeota archaeon]|nr:SCP2 sterol-binding domain-containing protein [Candidatus Lokiarchaeota archaeon]